MSELITIDSGELVFDVQDRTPAGIRQYIQDVTTFLQGLPERMEMPADHTFIDGVYTRTLRIPKGTVLVGQIHLKECVNIVAKGDITILTESGMGRIQAGHVAVSQPGIQKLGYAHEDTVFINVFRTDKTDIEQIEAEIATVDYSSLRALEEA